MENLLKSTTATTVLTSRNLSDIIKLRSTRSFEAAVTTGRMLTTMNHIREVWHSSHCYSYEKFEMPALVDVGGLDNLMESEVASVVVFFEASCFHWQ